MMSDNNAHPGVRSLLAKFENSPSQVNSPPSRGRSPVCSDTPGSTRPLSKVRASFVTVDGVVQSNPGSPLRKTSGRSDSSGIFGPKINEQAVEARRQNVATPTPGSPSDSQRGVLDQVAKAVVLETNATVVKNSDNNEPTPAVNTASPGKETPPKKTEKRSPAASTPTPATAASDKPAAKVITKRPSSINATKASVSHKPASPAASTASKQPATTGTKSARETAKERAGTLATKPSRAALNSAVKAAPRTTRGSTPSQESSKTSPPNSAKAQPRSPTKPVRLPASMTAQTQASSAKVGSTAPATGRISAATSTLTRKPSSLKSAAGAGQTRSPVNATTSVRRQPSRPSLPSQTNSERPSSRVSSVGTSKPAVNEGFLARMMRPTASSASKSHEKPDEKPAQPSTTVHKSPRASLARTPERSVQQPKAKPLALRPQSEKTPASNKEPLSKKEPSKPKVTQPEQDSEKENVEDQTLVIPEEPESTDAHETIETSKPEAPVEVPTAVAKEEVNEPAVESSADAIEPTAIEAPVEPTPAPIEPTAESIEKEEAQESAESTEKTDDVVASSEVAKESPVEISTEAITDGDATPEFADAQTESTEEVFGTPSDSGSEKETGAAHAEDAVAEKPSVSEAPPSLDGPTDIADEVAKTTNGAIAVPEDLTKSEEKPAGDDSVAQEVAPEAKQDVEEIDFVSLALN
ncbi:uncharacterized protein N7483_000494 [Penicillium malachiteum]|uniref:uncharacterized protein n=1 Tax=Penicillium malachiteum TaxID=1324776 RepID=UPI0025490E55|nr:uncharacterized protein N7483_000494 [Penicillium malachiteum]KAJ5735369.1 hypothetical protein N7483_000494 [Penicillium malachiteum]